MKNVAYILTNLGWSETWPRPLQKSTLQKGDKSKQIHGPLIMFMAMELGSLNIIFGQPPFYATPPTPIQALHNKCSKFISQQVQKKISVPRVLTFANTRT
jgi:hypothetical protein